MARYQYNGEEERVFPTLGITVKKGDSFDAPDDFQANGVSSASSSSKKTPVEAQPSQERE